MEEILHQAEQLEKEYDWAGAAGLYEKALNLLPQDDFSKMGEIRERLGYAFYRFAFQAESKDEFRETLHQSTVAYEKAVEFSGRLDEPLKTARTSRCKAMIAYIGYWLASEASEKKRLVDGCWALAKASLKALRESGLAHEYGRTYNLLSASALFGFSLEWDYQARKRVLNEAMEYGEVAVEFLVRTDDVSELARASAKTSFCASLWSYYFADLDERDDSVRKAQDYWSKAKSTCEDSARPEMLYPICGAHDLLWGVATEEALASINGAMELGKKARDRFIVGSAFDWLAYHNGWTIIARDDPDECAEIKKRVGEYAEEAKRQYSSIAFISPRADLCWIEAIRADRVWVFSGYRFETDPQKRQRLIEEAIDAGNDIMKRAQDSGYQWAICMFNWNISVALQYLARIETRPKEKKRLLEKALEHRKESLRLHEQLEPLGYWDLGLQHATAAEIKYDLLWLSDDPETRRAMLDEALAELEKAVTLMARDLEYQPQKRLAWFGNLGEYQYIMGVWLSSLYELTRDGEYLKKAVAVFNEAGESYQKTRRISDIAECYWRAAQAQDGLGEHLKGAESFSLASSSFTSAVENVPQLERLYEQHALYMQAWAEIEKARYHHERQEYGQAQEHFEKAGNIHKSLKQWSYLAPDYFAWAELEKGEDLSRTEKTEEAINAFEQAKNFFADAKKSLQAQLDKIEDADEKALATSMIHATGVRLEYCLARTVVEEARLLDKQGDHYRSSEKYDLAAEKFEKIGQTLELESERREMKFITTLSRAWEKMTLAEAKSLPTLYLDASQLFEQAEDLSPNEKIRTLILGHSRFCRALEAGTRFADTRDMDMYANAIKCLESAATYYVKAGFPKSSDYSEATKLLFDAYLRMDDAARENDPEKKAKLYTMAEKVLQTSAGSFTRAEHPEKSEQVLELLEKARKERELAVSLTEVLHAPSIVSTTATFTTPTPNQESAVGLERFEHAEIQANLIIRRKELRIGENLHIELELVNAGKGSALLTKVMEIIPKGFEVAEEPETCRVEDSYLDLKGKCLDPLKTVELKLILKPTVQGTFSLKPTVLYLDENGKYKLHEPEPVMIIVRELGIKGWLKGER